MKTNVFTKQWVVTKPNKFLCPNITYPFKSITAQSDGSYTGYLDLDKMSSEQKLSFWAHYYNVMPSFNIKGVEV